MPVIATCTQSPNVRTCSSPCLQLPVGFFSIPWKHVTVCMGGLTLRTVAAAHSPIETRVKKRRQTQKKMKKSSLFAGEVLPYHVWGDLENGQAFNNDEVGNDDDDGDKEQNDSIKREKLKEKVSQILSNAQRLKMGLSRYPACYTLGIDFGGARTGVAISKGFAPRPVEVVELQGTKLEARLIEIAQRERASEFVVGLPKNSRGLETLQSNRARSFAGRLAVLAAQRGWCVYLHDEFGTSNDALDYMLTMGSTRKGRKTQLDAYAAVVLLQAYFNSSGKHAELVVPKKLSLQECLCEALVVLESDDDGDFEDEQM